MSLGSKIRNYVKEFATRAETNAGTIDNKAVSPLSLKTGLDSKEDKLNKVTTIRLNGVATDIAYPSEKAVRDALDTLSGDFIGLTDTPNDFTGLALNILRLNAAETAVEAVSLAANLVSYDNTTSTLTGNPATTQAAIEALKALIDNQPLQTSVADFASLPDPAIVVDGAIIHVIDASGDPTVTSGWAKYQEIGDVWFKYLSQEDLSVLALTDAQVLDDANIVTGTVTGKQLNDVIKSYLIDEDNLISDDNNKVPTQQSVKTYVDNSVPNALTDIQLSDIANTDSGLVSGESLFLREFTRQGTEAHFTAIDGNELIPRTWSAKRLYDEFGDRIQFGTTTDKAALGVVPANTPYFDTSLKSLQYYKTSSDVFEIIKGTTVAPLLGIWSGSNGVSGMSFKITTSPSETTNNTSVVIPDGIETTLYIIGLLSTTAGNEQNLTVGASFNVLNSNGTLALISNGVQRRWISSPAWQILAFEQITNPEGGGISLNIGHIDRIFNNLGGAGVWTDIVSNTSDNLILDWDANNSYVTGSTVLAKAPAGVTEIEGTYYIGEAQSDRPVTATLDAVEWVEYNWEELVPVKKDVTVATLADRPNPVTLLSGSRVAVVSDGINNGDYTVTGPIDSAGTGYSTNTSITVAYPGNNGIPEVAKDNAYYLDETVGALPTPTANQEISISVIQANSTDTQTVKDAAKARITHYRSFDTGAGFIWVETENSSEDSDIEGVYSLVGDFDASNMIRTIIPNDNSYRDYVLNFTLQEGDKVWMNTDNGEMSGIVLANQGATLKSWNQGPRIGLKMNGTTVQIKSVDGVGATISHFQVTRPVTIKSVIKPEDYVVDEAGVIDGDPAIFKDDGNGGFEIAKGGTITEILFGTTQTASAVETLPIATTSGGRDLISVEIKMEFAGGSNDYYAPYQDDINGWAYYFNPLTKVVKLTNRFGTQANTALQWMATCIYK